GQFAINNDQYSALLTIAATNGLNELFVLSTCNRTEIYGFAPNAASLIELLCSQTSGDTATFKKAAYIKSGFGAIEHLFNVGAGLDSQILGDYEIVGQLKTAVKFAKEAGFVGAFTERLINAVLQSSKLIKNTTGLSGGTVSVSFAAVQYIRNKVKNIAGKNILLLGVGKIGRNTCKNLVDYLDTKNITLINRTEEKATELAMELGLRSASLTALAEEIKKAAIILVATNAAEPTITKEHLENGNEKLIIDLSIPYNVEEAAQHLPNVRLVNVDELSRLKDETLKKREAEVPKAKAIIAASINEFTEWNEMRKHVPLLKEVKLKLKEIHTHPLLTTITTCTKERDANIQRAINDMACKIRIQNRKGCQYIEAINHFIKAGVNN
ncbi:MAG TPA: glutamyl-tRNA reductase, partial [Chitinophagaceae bacterium]|nr:glutamyl-tRNA reductase [Chitinophagaceae bacterium]